MYYLKDAEIVAYSTSTQNFNFAFFNPVFNPSIEYCIINTVCYNYGQ